MATPKSKAQRKVRLAPSGGWASLAEWIVRKRSEAWREIRKAKRDNFVAGYEITHQHGRLAVLAELRKDFPRTREARPNVAMSREESADK